MNWSKIDEKLIDAYVVLSLAGRLEDKVVPDKYHEEVEIRIAKKTIEILNDNPLKE